MSGLSKDFFELIKSIGESKSKQEEERIIVEEVKSLKALLSAGGTTRRARELLVRLIYVEMLGHDASWGYVVAVQQTASHDLSQKRAGYLACGLMLSPDHDFRFMLVNQIQRDLASANVLEASAALVAVCKLVTADMIPALVTKVSELLEHDQTLVRKKAVMALHRFYQIDAHSVLHLTDKIKAKLRDRDPSVMGAALCLLHDMARVDPGSQADLVDQYVSILKQITEHRLPREFDHHRMPAPWIQIKLLQLLATLGNNDKRNSEAMYEVLGECMRRADTGTNIGYAVVYEVVKTITTIWPDPSLLDAAASAISRFITSDSYNLKYLGVTGLAAVVREHPKYAAQHQVAVIECLEDPDETLKRKTLELLFRMTNPVNAEVVVDKLLGFLKDANDQFLRTDLVQRISQLAERYSPDNTWYIETMTRVFTMAGDLVDAEVAHNVLRLLAEGGESEDDNTEMRTVACRLFAQALDRPVVPMILLKVAFWTLGEYAYLLQGELQLDEATRRVCAVIERSSTSEAVVRAYGVSAVAKMTAQLNRVLPEAAAVMRRFGSSQDTDLAQRCREFAELFASLPVLAAVLPVDASCEDFDEADMSFLDEFVHILQAAGQPAYSAALAAKTELEEEDEDKIAAQPQVASLRFDAYEAPKVYVEPPVVQQQQQQQVETQQQQVWESSDVAHSLEQQQQQPQATEIKAAKAVWGPQGYTGTLSGTLGGQAAVPEPAQRVVEAPPPVRQAPEPAVEQASSTPPPPLPKKPPTERVLTEKEKMAAALFGGLDGKQPSRARRGKQASSTEDSSLLSFEAGNKQQPQPNLMDDLFGSAQPGDALQSGKSTDASAEKPVELFHAQAPGKPSGQADMLDLFGAPADKPKSVPQQQQQQQQQQASIMDLFSAPVPNNNNNNALDTLFFATTPAPPPLPPLKPLSMTTATFGGLWGQHSSERRLTVAKPGTKFDDFLAGLQAKLGMGLVELIPATSEAILCGQQPGGATVLMHCKDRGQAVDVMVRAKTQALVELVSGLIK